MNNTNQITTHLEYLGYTIDQNENDKQVFYASRPGYTTLMVLVNDTRVWFYAHYEINSIAKCNIDKVFKYVILQEPTRKLQKRTRKLQTPTGREVGGGWEGGRGRGSLPPPPPPR